MRLSHGLCELKADGAYLSAIAALALFWVADSALAQAGPPPIPAGHNVKYYQVNGLTLGDLLRSLDQRAPTGPRGIRAYGLTEWHVSWRYLPRRRGKSCVVAQISTELRTRVTLPRWVEESAAPPSLTRRWNAFLRALTEHEKGHLENGRAAERAIAEALSKLDAAPGCAVASQTADQTALEILWRHQAIDKKYDRDTRYGRNQFEAALSPE